MTHIDQIHRVFELRKAGWHWVEIAWDISQARRSRITIPETIRLFDQAAMLELTGMWPAKEKV